MSAISTNLGDVGTYNQTIYRLSLLSLWILNFTYLVFNVNKFLNTKLFVVKSFFVLLIYLIFHLYIFPDINNSFGTQFFRILAISVTFLSFITNYILFKKNQLEKYFIYIFFIVFLSFIYTYIRDYNSIKFLLENDQISFNSSYVIIFSTPLVLLLPNKYIKIISILVALLIILSSNKRGGLIAFLFSIIIFFIVRTKFLKGSKKIMMYLYLASFLVFGLLIFDYFNSLNDGFLLYRLKKLDTDGGSGRMDIYSQVIDSFSNSSILEMFFGHGDNSVSKINKEGLSAHNDFLEIIYSYGLILLVVYLVVIISLIKYGIKMYKQRFRYTDVYVFSLIIFLIFSLISHVFIYQYFILLSIFWALVIGVHQREYLLMKRVENEK